MPLSIRQQFQNDESLEHDTDKSSKNKTKNDGSLKHDTDKSSKNKTKNVGSLEHDTDKSSKNKTKKQHNAGDFAFIVSQLAGIATELKEISANQQTILDRLNVARDCVIEEKFTEKHSLDLPFRSQPEFVKFNKKLHTNDEFRKDFISSLHSLLDRELKISKSLTNICKKYLSRDVALKYTVLRKVAGKSLLKDIMFYDCVLGVAIQTHKDHLTGKKITEQIVDSALGRVVNNAKDWDGQRQKRASSQSVKAPPAGIAIKNDNSGAVHGPLTTDDSSYDEESGAEKSATGESDHEETDHKESDNEEPNSEKDADGE